MCTSLQTCDHPKESSVTYCIPNRRKADSFSDAEKFIRLRNDGIKRNGQGVTSSERFESLSVSLPFCATLMVQKPATTILSTGRMAYPVQHAVGAVSEKCTTRVGVGRVAVLGSGKMAADKWFDRADNSKILDLFLHLLLPCPQRRSYNPSPSKGHNEASFVGRGGYGSGQGCAQRVR